MLSLFKELQNTGNFAFNFLLILIVDFSKCSSLAGFKILIEFLPLNKS